MIPIRLSVASVGLRTGQKHEITDKVVSPVTDGELPNCYSDNAMTYARRDMRRFSYERLGHSGL